MEQLRMKLATLRGKGKVGESPKLSKPQKSNVVCEVCNGTLCANPDCIDAVVSRNKENGRSREPSRGAEIWGKFAYYASREFWQ